MGLSLDFQVRAFSVRICRPPGVELEDAGLARGSKILGLGPRGARCLRLSPALSPLYVARGLCITLRNALAVLSLGVSGCRIWSLIFGQRAGFLGLCRYYRS